MLRGLGFSLVVLQYELMDETKGLANGQVPVDHHFTLPIHMESDSEGVVDCESSADRRPAFDRRVWVVGVWVQLE
jgi:hypothetical protein